MGATATAGSENIKYEITVTPGCDEGPGSAALSDFKDMYIFPTIRTAPRVFISTEVRLNEINPMWRPLKSDI
jgi:hypothetical protein